MTDSRFQLDDWKIIETRFEPERVRDSESIFALGNGMMGQRANFEERYSGDTLQGTYVAGIYYPDKTMVGWWKNGYPEYFAKVPNAPSWTGIRVTVDGHELDLATCRVSSFRRELDMRRGVLTRTFTAVMPSGRVAEVTAARFLSMSEPERAAIKYSVRLSGGNGPDTQDRLHGRHCHAQQLHRQRNTGRRNRCNGKEHHDGQCHLHNRLFRRGHHRGIQIHCSPIHL